MNKLEIAKQNYSLFISKYKIVLVIIVFFLAIENIMLAVNNLQNRIPVLGLKINNRNISIDQILQKNRQKTLRFIYKNQIFEVKRDELDTNIDTDKLANQILSAGRQGNWLDKIIFQNAALLGLKNFKITDNLSQGLLTVKILQIQGAVNKEALPLRPDFQNDINKTLPAVDGINVNSDKLAALIIDNIFNPPFFPIPLPTIKTFTTHSQSELPPIRKQAIKLTRQPLSIVSAGQVFTLTAGDLKSMLALSEKPDPHNPQKLVLVLRLDEQKLNQRLGAFAEQVEKITNAEFNDHAARTAIYSQFFSGKRFPVNIPAGSNLAEKKVLAAEAGSSTGKTVDLTFDDGPNNIYHPLILDILKKYNVRATFFLVGANAQRNSDIAKKTISDGHIVGNHSLTHPFLPNLAPAEITKELSQTDDILKPINNNNDIKLFRPPYGGVSLYVKNISTQLGLKLFLWDVDPRDWTEPGEDELVRRVATSVQNGSDILLHSNHLATVKALPKIIETLKSQGYDFDTLR